MSDHDATNLNVQSHSTWLCSANAATAGQYGKLMRKEAEMAEGTFPVQLVD